MDFKDNVRLLLEISQRTSNLPFKRQKMTSGEYNLIGTYIDELDNYLYKFYDTDEEFVKQTYVKKIEMAYKNLKQRIDEFIANNDQ